MVKSATLNFKKHKIASGKSPIEANRNARETTTSMGKFEYTNTPESIKRV